MDSETQNLMVKLLVFLVAVIVLVALITNYGNLAGQWNTALLGKENDLMAVINSYRK